MVESLAYGGLKYNHKFGTIVLPATGSITAPTLSSLNYTLGDTAGGGQSIVLTGTSLSTVTSVTFGGTTATITGQSSTTCTVTLPAHAAGAANVAATNPGGTATLTNGFTYWTPAQVSNIDSYLDSNKGVTATSGAVSQWVDQSSNGRTFTQSTGASQPTQIASVFGTLPSIRFVPQQSVELAAPVSFSTSGFSAFAVTAWTATRSSTTNGWAAPLTLISDNTGAIFCTCLGASAGNLCAVQYIAGWNSYTASSGLNDGTVRLIGWTEDSSGNLKAYVGTSQQGATQTTTYTSSDEYNCIGNTLNNADGWNGDVGAIVVCKGIISSGDLSNLNAWAQQRFGTP